MDRVPLPDGIVGAVELIMIFAHHIKSPGLSMRILGNKWTVEDIAKTQLLARGKLTAKCPKRRNAAVRKQMLVSGKYMTDNKEWTTEEHAKDLEKTSDYDVTGFTLMPKKDGKHGQRSPARLIDLADGLLRMPNDGDKGFLTQAVEYALRVGDTTSTTDDIPQLAIDHAFSYPMTLYFQTSIGISRGVIASAQRWRLLRKKTRWRRRLPRRRKLELARRERRVMRSLEWGLPMCVCVLMAQRHFQRNCIQQSYQAASWVGSHAAK